MDAAQLFLMKKAQTLTIFISGSALPSIPYGESTLMRTLQRVQNCSLFFSRCRFEMKLSKKIIVSLAKHDAKVVKNIRIDATLYIKVLNFM